MRNLLVFAFILFSVTPVYAGFKVGNVQKIITASESTVQITTTSTPYQQAVISADVSNDQVIVVGGSSVTATRANTNGVNLAPGERFILSCNSGYICGDVNSIYADAMASGDIVTVTYTQNTI